MRICLHQFIRPKVKFKIKGCGDCTTCIKDEDNKKCKCYVPINVAVVDIKDE